MHRERYTLSEEAARSVNRARGAGSRIVAVGTTALRVLETTLVSGKNEPGSGETELYLYPPKTVQSAEALITNFHTPRSTLLMLVCAFAGYDTIMEAYREAVKERYRFFSYGDAMLIV
jgi:S-adenosylmethionine:tRNA ribosyltransferase-isomerase